MKFKKPICYCGSRNFKEVGYLMQAGLHVYECLDCGSKSPTYLSKEENTITEVALAVLLAPVALLIFLYLVFTKRRK